MQLTATTASPIPIAPPTQLFGLSEPTVLFGAGIIVSAFAWFLTREVRSIEARLGRIESRLDTSQQELAKLPLQYVSREDYLRTMTAFDERIDRLESKLESKLDLLLERLSER
jgi:tetrahydromethanopterin S-methyltransferase subunit G